MKKITAEEKSIQDMKEVVAFWKSKLETLTTTKNEKVEQLQAEVEHLYVALEEAKTRVYAAREVMDVEAVKSASDEIVNIQKTITANLELLQTVKESAPTTEAETLEFVEAISNGKQVMVDDIQKKVVEHLRQAEILCHRFMEAFDEADELAFMWNNRAYKFHDSIYFNRPEDHIPVDDLGLLELTEDLLDIHAYREAVGASNYNNILRYNWTCSIDD